MATKVILTQDVEHLARRDGADGQGRVRPQLLAAEEAGGDRHARTIKQVQERQAAADRRIRKQEEELRSLGDKIAATTLTFTARVGESGRLFGSITAQEIADELSRVVGEEIDRRKVALEEPIRSIGTHRVPIRLVGRLVPEVTVIVAGEGGETAESAPAADEQPDQPEPPEA